MTAGVKPSAGRAAGRFYEKTAKYAFDEMMIRKVLVMGLPGAGKTTLARLIARRLNAVHYNADDIRREVSRDLGFSEQDRIEHARRLGWLCDQVTHTGGFAVADFICPTPATRAAFKRGGDAFVVWMDRVKEGSFADTNAMFVPPARVNVRVDGTGSAAHWADEIVLQLGPSFNWNAPTALFVGRYQPFHDGHEALFVEGIRRIGQACIAVREAGTTDDENLFAFEAVKARIDHALREFQGRFLVLQIPNATQVYCGRDVSYVTEQSD
jgi:adenylylsulfate kinase